MNDKNVIGSIDSIEDEMISGWVKRENRDIPLLIDALMNGEVIATGVVADNFREDVKAAGFGDGAYGFAIPFETDAASGPVMVAIRESGFTEALISRTFYIPYAEADEIFHNAVRFRQILEKTGLWQSAPLTDAEQQDAISDPARLCFDPVFFSSIWPGYRSSDSVEQGLEIFRQLSATGTLQPNLLFAESWYRRQNKAAAQALICGHDRSGLDHFLRSGLRSGFSPTDRISSSIVPTPSINGDLPNLVMDWLDGPSDVVPAHLEFRLPGADQISDQSQLAQAFKNAVSITPPEKPGTILSTALQRWLDGKDLVIINSNTHTRNIHITRAILNDAIDLIGKDHVHLANYHNVVNICAKLDNPVLICIDGQRLNSDIVKFAISYCSSAMLWTFDDPYNLNLHLKTADLFDLICTNDLFSLPSYGEKGFYLPLGASTELLKAPMPEDEQFDIFFCGTAWPNRIVLINRLMRDRPNLRFKIALTYNPAVPLLPLTGSISSYVQSLSFTDFIEYARRSRITLSLHRNFSGTDAFGVSTNPGPRVFEIGAAGAYQISENGGDGFHALFPSDLLSYYDDYDELLRLIDAALADTAGRREAALRLRNRVAELHSYQHRLVTILEQLMRIDAQRPAPVAVPQPARPKLLYVVHNIIRKPGFGGLEVHQDILAQNLRNHYDIYFFYCESLEGGSRRGILTDSEYETIEVSRATFGISHNNLENPELEKFFGSCLAQYEFSMIHFFHFINQTPSLSYIAQSYGVPYGISFHDFYTMCRQHILIDHKGNYCKNDRTKLSDCDICLLNSYNFPILSQLARRDYYGDVIANAGTLMFVSGAAKDIHEGVYPQTALAGSARVHGAPIPNSKWTLMRQSNRNVQDAGDRPTRFMILGNFDDHKGAKYLLDAINACKPIDAEFHFHGGINEKVQERFATKLGARAHFHGRYSPGEVDIAQYDFSLHLSVWPETYCQTLSEAWAARVVPIVTDIGALGQRVEHGVNGYKVDPERPATLGALLVSIADDRTSYLALRDTITDALFLDQEQHAALYHEAYQQVLSRSIAPRQNKPIDVPAVGVTMDVLQRRRRTPFWNKGKGPHSANREVVPNTALISQLGRLRPFNGTIELAEGALDQIGKTQVADLPEGPIEIKNAQPLDLHGWVRRQSMPKQQPVAILKTQQGIFLHSLAVEERGDVGTAFADSYAQYWGMAGEIRLLTPDAMITGVVDVSLGWLDAEAAIVRACGNSVQVVAKFGG